MKRRYREHQKECSCVGKICLLPLFFFIFFHSMAQVAPEASPQAQGPETIESPEKIGVQGNWVKKRNFLMQANDVGIEIQDIAAQTEPTRKMFIDKNNEIDSELDEYYKFLGLEEGKILELFENILRYLEKKKKKEVATLIAHTDEQTDPDLQAKIDMIEDSIKLSKQQLEQLKLDMKSIEDLDRSLGDRLKRLDTELNNIQEEATKAKIIVNNLWNIIDHNKARDSYYELKNTILEKIKNTQTYLKEDLFKDFESVVGTIRQQITRTKEQIGKLEKEGIFIKNRALRVKELKLKELQLKQDEATAQQAPQQPEPAKVTKPTTWYEQLYDYFISTLSSIYKLWTTLKEKFTGPASQPAIAKKPPAQQVPPSAQQQPVAKPETPPVTTPSPEAMPVDQSATPPTMPTSPQLPQIPTTAAQGAPVMPTS